MIRQTHSPLSTMFAQLLLLHRSFALQVEAYDTSCPYQCHAGTEPHLHCAYTLLRVRRSSLPTLPAATGAALPAGSRLGVLGASISARSSSADSASMAMADAEEASTPRIRITIPAEPERGETGGKKV